MSAYRLIASWLSNNCFVWIEKSHSTDEKSRYYNSKNSGAQTNNLHVEMYSIIILHFRQLSSQMIYVSGEKSLKVLLLEF